MTGRFRTVQIADDKRVDPPVLHIGVLAAGKGPLHHPEPWDAKLAGEVMPRVHRSTQNSDQRDADAGRFHLGLCDRVCV